MRPLFVREPLHFRALRKFKVSIQILLFVGVVYGLYVLVARHWAQQ
jgi:hypothetical protein